MRKFDTGPVGTFLFEALPVRLISTVGQSYGWWSLDPESEERRRPVLSFADLISTTNSHWTLSNMAGGKYNVGSSAMASAQKDIPIPFVNAVSDFQSYAIVQESQARRRCGHKDWPTSTISFARIS